ncbi:hypothetical protein MKW94_009734 [Papaver nudicaule]|uniref:Uncharacterized protein n=1 Tax=Papaver nudicaule TaxID=74823 RepID=A0AA41UX28_PAPNU|nr:hypothetical protein [Papaver nudicaule]
MSLLEIITRAAAAAAADSVNVESSKYPIILNANSILTDLKPEKNHGTEDDTKLIKRVQGWKISEIDTEIIESGNKFIKNLNKKLKNPKSFDSNEFLGFLNSFLKKICGKVGVSVKDDDSITASSCLMLEKCAGYIGKNVSSLILETSIRLEIWEVLRTLIEKRVCKDLIENLVKKRRSDLLCLCIKHVADIQSSDLVSLFKYFLTPPKGSRDTMMNVRKDWEKQANLAIDKIGEQQNHIKVLAKEASILLMIAYDGFTSSELCLHYLFASSNLDQLTFSFCLSRLSGTEMLSLIMYLGKWLKKYEKFPQAAPCPRAAKKLGLEACDWVPELKSVVKYLGVVLDEHFSKLVLYTEFQDELRLIDGVVKSLACGATLCCSIADIVENLKVEVERQKD